MIPKKGAAKRVFVFGGSNTQGFPVEKLEAILNAQSEERFEAFNLGRRGYGSGRVRLLFEQSMAAQPDIAIIYSAHNEFVEKSFALDLEEMGASRLDPWIRAASHLRAFNAMVGALADDSGRVSTPKHGSGNMISSRISTMRDSRATPGVSAKPHRDGANWT